jgi:hypothetical protein
LENCNISWNDRFCVAKLIINSRDWAEILVRTETLPDRRKVWSAVDKIVYNGELKYSERIVIQCQCIHHKSDMDFPGRFSRERERRSLFG